MARPKILVLDDDLSLADKVSYAFPWCSIEWFTNPTTAYQSEAYARATLIVVDGDTIRRSGVAPAQVLNRLQQDSKKVIVVSTRPQDNPTIYPFFLKPLTLQSVRSEVRNQTGYQDDSRFDIPPT